MDTEPEQYLTGLTVGFDIIIRPLTPEFAVVLPVLALLILFSTLVSGAKVAFFSLGTTDLNVIKKSRSKSMKLAFRLLEEPDRLLGTILIANIFINVAIIILSAYLVTGLFGFGENKLTGFIITVVPITLILLFFGEITPTVFANRYALSFSRVMARPLFILSRVVHPLNWVLINMTMVVKRRVSRHRKDLSLDQLSDALELTELNAPARERSILKGIVKFGDIYVREVMTSRVDVVSVDVKTSFARLIDLVVESGYSRIPVYQDNFDNINGILYIKDLLVHLGKSTNFKWQSLIRIPYFVPETKKIDDLLKEFQVKKIHMAIVVDEYGGTSGIITLEDILEEIVGEIADETDDDESFYTQMDDNSYIFEGKTLLNDFCEVLGLEDIAFDEVRGEADTLAGMLLELKGDLPVKNELLSSGDFEFKVVAVDNRRIRKVHVKVLQPKK